MDAEGSSKKMVATQQEMVENKVPTPYRDQCAHLLIPLKKCRQSEIYLPWKCEDERHVYEKCECERHVYEKCEYELVMERMPKIQKIREEEAKLNQSKKQRFPLIPSTANAYN